MIYDLGNRLHLRIDHRLVGAANLGPFGRWVVNVLDKAPEVVDDKPAAYERLRAAERRRADT